MLAVKINYCPISDQKMYIIKQAETLVFFHNDCLWTKRNNPEFNVAMGTNDFAETCDIIRILFLWHLGFMFDIKNTGLKMTV